MVATGWRECYGRGVHLGYTLVGLPMSTHAFLGMVRKE